MDACTRSGCGVAVRPTSGTGCFFVMGDPMAEEPPRDKDVGFTGLPASLYAIGYLKHLDGHLRSRTAYGLFNMFLASMCLVPCAAPAAGASTPQG